MALGEILGNFSDLISALPVEAVDKVLGLVLVLKAVGIAAIVYVIYVVVMGVLTYRKMKKLEHIERKVDLIDEKMNKLVKKKS